MNRRAELQNSLVVMLLIAAVSRSDAAEPAAESLASRPYYSLFVASIDRCVAVCDAVFETVDRPDLAATLSERQKAYRNFAGIDRTKSLGMMAVWNNTRSDDIVFLPVKDINELMKTATFDVVEFHASGPNRFEIERPESPYHVLVRNNYALFADSLSTIQALQVTPEQLTRGSRDRYDVVLQLELKQFPQPTKVKYIEGLRALIEPWLQRQDEESTESANLRKALGKLALDTYQRLALDTTTATIGAQLDPKTRHIIFEVVVEAAPASPMANGLSRLISQRNEFAPLVSPDVPAGLALNLPLGGLVDQVLGRKVDPNEKAKRIEAGLQLVGTELGKLSLIAALRGDEAVDLNVAIPILIAKFEKSGKFISVDESFDAHKGIVLHSLVPRELPTAITEMAGRNVEIIVGQGKQTVWLGIGQPETLLDRLKDAIELVDEPSTDRTAGPLVRARFHAKQLPDFLASDLLIPAVDAEASRAAFAKGEDGFSLTLEPVANGIKLRIEAEEGFVRLIGRDWIKQIESSLR